ncbi:Fic family protein [Phycisphaerales bacterium ac7]
MPPVQYHSGGFPPKNLNFEELVPLIGPASAAIARYEGVLHAVPNTQVLLSPLTTQEAVLSSKIEGTQATFGEVLEFEAAEDTATGEKRNDIREVLNYRAALRHAVSLMEELPLSQRLMRDAHSVLMQGVRGDNKTPGEYRRVPNWIGAAGCEQDQARFVPPGAGEIADLMSAWERYLHAEAPDRLVQMAVLHAEFESIHPFLDGNGRLGRLLVPLFLVDKKLLSGPHFYVSEYLESHRDEYYNRLLAVSRDGDWTGWCRFFLTAILRQAETNERKARQILDLHRTKRDWAADVTHSQYAGRAIDWWFERPIFKTTDYINSVGIPDQTARRILQVVRDEGVLREIRPASGRRPAIVAFPELLNIAEGREAF